MIYGVGAHEPIFHRQRTGNSTAEEWDRWIHETSDENLDCLEKLGVSRVQIACAKGFGLEYEKPLIERAAKFAEKAKKRGIETSAYIQGFPIYYETFLLEVPEAENWFARNQHGSYIPWSAQTFRRWIDPTREEFLNYELKLISYILDQFEPIFFNLDNTLAPPCYTDSCRNSFRQYLNDKFGKETAQKEFGLPSFDGIDLPHFDSIYYPPDAYSVVKDPLLQEWSRWQSKVSANFCTEIKNLIHSKSSSKLYSNSGCNGLKYNHLWSSGADFEDRFECLDNTGMEESMWRPGVIEPDVDEELNIVMDERHVGSAEEENNMQVRISTDSRFAKIKEHYGIRSSGSFWGEQDRVSKLIALAHNAVFCQDANHIGSIGPLCAHPQMKDDIQDYIDWGNRHLDILTERENRVTPIALWRGTSTMGFIRYRPVHQACMIEQMLYENHFPFTILLDGGLEKYLENIELLILPGVDCIADRQIEIITDFVDKGGKLLLLGTSGTRDEWTRVRKKYAFHHLFGNVVPDMEWIGPPHWVPELNIDKMPDSLNVNFGKGSVSYLKNITPLHSPDLTRDPYMPERHVMAKDVTCPKNEKEILNSILSLYGDHSLKIEAPRWTLCEFWKQGNTLLICLANLSKSSDGGPVEIQFGDISIMKAEVIQLFEENKIDFDVHDGVLKLSKLDRFCAIKVKR
ncbi:MAG: hypothetical protein COA79_24440 [Planctomycetota bacterium]|nr:MAG: hypothetical protein COA79_24440 [Planctomycetota bacterium]